MDIIVWLIILAVIIAVVAVGFVLIRKRQRGGGVIASGSVRNSEGSRK